MRATSRVGLAAVIVLLGCATVPGAQVAFDSAGDSAYNSGWTQGTNGGFGWGGGWTISTPGSIAFIGDSTSNGEGDPEGDGDINSPRAAGGRAWGLLSGGATRAFSGSLSLGQTFSIDFDDSGGTFVLSHNSSVFLLNPGGAEAIGILSQHGADYLLRLPSGDTVDTGVAETDQGLHFAFTQLAASVQVSLRPYISGSTTATFTAPYSDQLAGVEFGYGVFGLTSPSQAAYINNIAITPEPSSTGLFSLAAATLVLRRRRR